MKCPQCSSEIENGAVVCSCCNAALPYADVTIALTEFQNIYGTEHVSYLTLAETDVNVHSLLTQANLCRVRSQWAEAIDFCVCVLRISPADLATHSLLGDIYRDQGKFEDAVQWYRMAFDLGASPIDREKLEKAEKEIKLILAHRSSKNSGSGKLSPLDDESFASGTVNLLGISPQRWLRAITITSITCAILMVLGLSWLSISRRHQSSPTLPPKDISTEAKDSSSEKNSPLLQETTGIRTGAVGGQGFRPDNLSARNTANSLPAPINTINSDRESSRARAFNVTPAPVNKVTPLPSILGQDVSGVGESSASMLLISRANPLTLSAGMNVVQAVPDRGNGTVSIQVAAISIGGEDSSSPSREQLVRTCYRASKAIFDTDSTLARATITIALENSSSSGDNRLAISEVDRGQIYASSIETDPSDVLEKRMASFHMLTP